MITFLYLFEMNTMTHPNEYSLSSGSMNGLNRIAFVEPKDLIGYAKNNRYRIPTVFNPAVQWARAGYRPFSRQNTFQYSSEKHLLLMDDVIRYCDKLIEFKDIRNAEQVGIELSKGLFKYDTQRYAER